MELSYDYFVKGCHGDGPGGKGVGHAKACFNAALLNLNEFQGAYKRSTPANPKAGVEFLKKVGVEDNVRQQDHETFQLFVSCLKCCSTPLSGIFIQYL